jgi:CRISPR-associated endonuclease/helicase Cas3
MKRQIPNNEALAHSARTTVVAQSYKAHVERVTAIATENAQRVARYYRGDGSAFVEAVRAAAIFHDLGKLDEENQKVLVRSATERLPIKHWDASSAHLLSLNRLESAVLAFAHHIGLPNYHEHLSNKDLAFRVTGEFERTNKFLADFVRQHEGITHDPLSSVERTKSGWTGLTRRLALSCLVDADHSDTAEHYGSETSQDVQPLRPSERLAALDQYISSLPKGTPGQTNRNRLRQEVYLACRNAPTDTPIWACDSPVGTGKTTAIMAHLLQAAADKDLRHAFIVLPYTNIIKQSVNVYRRSLTLRGEQSEEIVAEHHHLADFSSREFRHLAQLWNAPVTVTTAVQFFETLGSNQTSRLRKLHEIAGSAILIDESHAAMPLWLWPQMWKWLIELTENWGCHIVFASGSLVRFWALDDFVETKAQLPELVRKEVRDQALAFEGNRVTYHTHESALTLPELLDFVLEKPGPRLIILNTVQSAAVVADEMRGRCGGHAVYHLSTSLCPVHRDAIVKRLLKRLQKKEDCDWTLVATSCVEAGMDFSFRTAFREHCGMVNLIQIGGRVNRSGDYATAEVWDFRVLDSLLPPHPAFQASQEVLEELFRENAVNLQSSTEAIRREVQRESIKKPSDKLQDREKKLDYPEVAKLCRIIESDTRMVVIDLEIVQALERWEKVTRSDLVKHSVQIWNNKLKSLPTRPVRGNEELLAWIGPYDADFLGYMAGVIPLLEERKIESTII